MAIDFSQSPTIFIESLCEALWVCKVSTTTPGKMLMGIIMIHYDVAIFLDSPASVLIRSAEHLAPELVFTRALIRNILMEYSPIYLAIFFLMRNRMIYDLIFKTVVVEENPISPP
jgi:uncharacterized RDD family membrane protein YckC